MEEKITQEDPLTKNLLGLSANILKKPDKDKDHSTKTYARLPFRI